MTFIRILISNLYEQNFKIRIPTLLHRIDVHTFKRIIVEFYLTITL